VDQRNPSSDPATNENDEEESAERSSLTAPPRGGEWPGVALAAPFTDTVAVRLTKNQTGSIVLEKRASVRYPALGDLSGEKIPWTLGSSSVTLHTIAYQCGTAHFSAIARGSGRHCVNFARHGLAVRVGVLNLRATHFDLLSIDDAMPQSWATNERRETSKRTRSAGAGQSSLTALLGGMAWNRASDSVCRHRCDAADLGEQAGSIVLNRNTSVAFRP
jgi:hypothetical protein